MNVDAKMGGGGGRKRKEEGGGVNRMRGIAGSVENTSKVNDEVSHCRV